MAALSPEFPPLLFTLPSEQPPEFRTPRSIHSPRRDGASGSISTARRSVTPPGSVGHTDTTPPRPPPITRLQDTLMMDVDMSPPGGGGSGSAAAHVQQPGQTAGGGLLRIEAAPAADDVWVTIFGFAPEDLPLVLREFQRCGDILQWGTFGASAQANFMHVQFASAYAAQRALLRSGEQLSGTLIVGVKPLEPRHRALVEAHGGGAGAGGNAELLGVRGGAPAARPYRVDAAAATALPHRSRTLVQKLSEFVLGM